MNGTIIGQRMDAQDSVSNVVDLASGGIVSVDAGGSAGLVLITDAPKTCGSLTAKELKKNAKLIFIQVGTQAGSSTSPPSESGKL